MARYTFKIPGHRANLDDIEDLAAALQKWVGTRVQAVEAYEIVTTSDQAAQALQVLTGVKPSVTQGGDAPKIVHPGKGAQDPAPDLAVEPMGPAEQLGAQDLVEQLGEHGATWALADASFKDAPKDKPRTRGLEPGRNRKPRSATSWGAIKAWQVIPPGARRDQDASPESKITRDDMDQRLLEGTFAPGTLLRHPRGGSWVVVGKQGYSQSLRRSSQVSAED